MSSTVQPLKASRQQAWLRLLQEESEAVFYAAWLSLLADNMDGVAEMALVLGPANQGPFAPVASWPHKSPCSEALQQSCEQVLEMRRPITRSVEGRAFMAIPVQRGYDMLGVLGIGFEQSQIAESARTWAYLGLGWLLAHPSTQPRQEGGGELNERLLLLLDLMLSGHAEEKPREAFQAVLSEAAIKLGCDRISLGTLKGKRVRLQAMSSAADFAKKIDLTLALEAAMNEATDQGSRLMVPADAETLATVRAHEALLRDHGNEAALTVPFFIESGHCGALCFEWVEAPSTDTVGLAEGLAAVVGRVLLERELADLSTWGMLRRSGSRALHRLFGPRYLGRKLLLSGFLLLALFFTFAHGQFRVSAEAGLEGTVHRTISAPFDGFVAESFYRAGQVVDEGTVLASLDDRDLRLEYLRWSSQRAQFEREMRSAQGRRDSAGAQVAEAQMRQAEAQMDMARILLERTAIVAPFAAVITAGDLSQDLGRPVQRGASLFELAPVADYRVVVEVDEGDIAEVLEGQRGSLVLKAFPEQKFTFDVSLVTPVSEPGDGKNRFRVEGRLYEHSEAMRPGMRGVAKIDVRRERLIWIWTRDMRHWLRLQRWRWLGF
ncbi:Barrel-sandwich domain of CusB or HlyD membrane-fusion [Ectothiorhodosinus mongolicus]|uniref:Barrel-sandwich domain of CusB or HlyD membrane-fusion n=1 Tax=Ectothiorhodosinus mongolicus TaxID=233100 RepID=A0A1R3VMC7_9GAMM|nr:HlyD family efflux transporter periplasmic adaptor subunit [Ectothiorhodosinus mongolicus]ULX56237.1 hypothetical protein CKX93_00035 [Ectothiorhodosinus mongolicus]SIT65741.1 Barrel-sandwich domain of CusB or HlyD membrane-fusion [Ectothiorhodosinus mongolicus]